MVQTARLSAAPRMIRVNFSVSACAIYGGVFGFSRGRSVPTRKGLCKVKQVGMAACDGVVWCQDSRQSGRGLAFRQCGPPATLDERIVEPADPKSAARKAA